VAVRGESWRGAAVRLHSKVDLPSRLRDSSLVLMFSTKENM
jgi:hypothetical protein